MNAAVNNRRNLRTNSTKAEHLLWGALRSRKFHGLKFRRQHPIGPFIADFACPEIKLVIELDGDYHDYVEERDRARQMYIEAEGYRVIRFENNVVLRDVEAVLIAIERMGGIRPSS